MRTTSVTTRLVRPLLCGALLAIAACKSEPPSQPTSSLPDDRQAEISNEFTASAHVAAIAPAERVLTLRRDDGSQFDVQVDPVVRNFDQIAVGDALRVRYKELLVATKLSASESARSPQSAVAAARAPAGAKPGAGIGVSVNLRVRIESIDLKRDIVVFSLDSGELIARRLRTSEGREFVAGLAVGDMVQLDYAQVLALAVEEV